MTTGHAPSAADYQGERVVVTGASRGIGLAVAREFVRGGASVLGTGRDAKALREVAAELGKGFESCEVDFADATALGRFADRLAGETVTSLVNNAGLNKLADIRDLSDEDWDLVLGVNLTAPARLAHAVAKGMASRKNGRIVNISSIWGVVSRRTRDSYSAAKAGLIGLTRAMALDLAGSGVLVNAVCPGFTDTELTRKILPPSERAELEASIPLKRFAEPDEIARLIVFLASSANTYITGQAVVIDGGYTAQ